MPYLIAHKVRGQPAFDIANCCEDMGTPSDPGPWWILPSTGHRAYPYWSTPLDSPDMDFILSSLPTEVPDDLPDFCEHRWDRVVKTTIEGNSLLTQLGLLKPAAPKEPLWRRV